MTTTAMIVMERGGDWPGQIGDATNVVAFGQGCDDLLQSTREKLGTLHRGHQSVRVAVLACGSAEGAVAAGRRAQLARLLLAAVASTTCGRLILSASGCASPQLREEMFSLAGTLTEELGGTTATVSLRFAEALDGRVLRSGTTYAGRDRGRHLF